ncbi:caffeine synthase 1-like [Chenopodium quinoa]|uniref:caffeine synthase 1-like n=1 Tax=Chenopodium quinoa TaxID=63459 RepID=UPI000B76BE02|nr:caffeine synthase 1-like [Chenopodium quinoa]
MRINEFLHMNKGDGELSYVQNSFDQNGVWLMNQHLIESTIQYLISKDKGLIKGLNVADLGCGVGHVPLALVSLITEIMQRKFKELRLDSEPSCFLMGVPGSYYDVLFPRNSLHFVHSNFTLHWLSKTPWLLDNQGMSINKGNIHIVETSPKPVVEAYWAQFEPDFSQFLKCRSKEVVTNGFMLLTLTGSPCSTDSLIWTPCVTKILNEALICLISEGLIKEEKLDSFEFPMYLASTKQLEIIVQKEGSFAVEHSETTELDVAPEIEDKLQRPKILTKVFRAYSESILPHHFGEEIITVIYDKFTHYAFQHLVQDKTFEHYAVTVVLEQNCKGVAVFLDFEA